MFARGLLRNVPLGLLSFLAGAHGGAKTELADLLAALDDDRFRVRQEAAATLAERAGTHFDEVALALYSEAFQADAGHRAAASAIMRKVYRRLALGEGAPACGWSLEPMITRDQKQRAQFMPIVAGVEGGSPAAEAGLARGDEILTVNGERRPPTGGVAWLKRRVAAARPGEVLYLGVRRWQPKYPDVDDRVTRDGPGGTRTVILTLGPASEGSGKPFSEEAFASWLALELSFAQSSASSSER